MSRREYFIPENPQVPPEGLVLDVPLGSAALDQLTDCCGNALLYYGADNISCLSYSDTGFCGVRLTQSENWMNHIGWKIPQITSEWTLSFYAKILGVHGHGWSWLFLSTDTGVIVFTIRTSGGGYSKYELPGWQDVPNMAGDISFICIVADNDSWHFYIDGLEVRTFSSYQSEPFDVVGLRDPGTIGDAGNSANAIFRQLKLYNRGLAPDEVMQLYQAEKAVLLAECPDCGVV